jgi:hypothetical protein
VSSGSVCASILKEKKGSLGQYPKKKKRFWAVQGLNILPNLLLQKIKRPLISFFSGVSYIWGSSLRNRQ